eukprot:1160011-Pelagomonas_calceolata.AAC.5
MLRHAFHHRLALHAMHKIQHLPSTKHTPNPAAPGMLSSRAMCFMMASVVQVSTGPMVRSCSVRLRGMAACGAACVEQNVMQCGSAWHGMAVCGVLIAVCGAAMVVLGEASQRAHAMA